MARGNASLIMYQLGDIREEAIRNMRNLVRKYPMYSDMRAAALAAAFWVDGQQGEAESNWGCGSRLR